jgi:hypothetical protein
MAGALTSWARDSALGPAVLNEVLKTGVAYELQQVHAFNELLAARDTKVAELEKRKKAHGKHEALKASGASETAGSRFAGYAPKAMLSQKKPLDDVLAQAASELRDAQGAKIPISSFLSLGLGFFFLSLSLSLFRSAGHTAWYLLSDLYSMDLSPPPLSAPIRRSGVRERRSARDRVQEVRRRNARSVRELGRDGERGHAQSARARQLGVDQSPRRQRRGPDGQQNQGGDS